MPNQNALESDRRVVFVYRSPLRRKGDVIYMFHNIMQMLYESGLAAEPCLAKRARITFTFLEIAVSYIPQTHRGDAFAEMSSALADQLQLWDEEAFGKRESD